MNLLPSAVHVSSPIEFGAPRIHCLAMFANSPFSTFIWRPMNSLPSAVHVSSAIESGAPRIDCLALFANFPSSNLIRRPMNSLPSAVHVSSVIKRGASGDWEICFSVICWIGFFAKHVFFLQKAVASGGSNLARLGELGGKLLPYFAINRGRSEEGRGSTFLALLILSKLLRKIVSVKKIQAEALSIMASPPASPPPPSSPPPPPAPSDASASLSAADGTHKKKLRTYLGIVARDKVDVTYENWKEVPTAQKDLIWDDILTMGERWRQFKSDLTRKWALAADQDGVEDTVCEKYNISKENGPRCAQKGTGHPEENTAPHLLSHGGYDYLEQKLLAEKTKKKLEEAAQSGSVDGVIDPPSPVRRHVKWKMARTKKTGEMTTEAAKEIAAKIGSFVPHGRQDVLAAAIERPEHPKRVRAAGAGVTIKQYFGSAPRTSRSSSSLPPEELQQLTQQIRDQLEESITERGLALPPEPLVGPSGPRVSTNRSCVDPSGNDPETGDSDRCGLYIEADPAHLVALGRVYEGSTVVHNTPFLPGQVKVGVEEVTDANAPVLVPTNEVSLVGQAFHTFLAWPTHLVKSLSQQVAVSPAKPPPKPNPEVDDPLYLMTLTIPELFLRPYQVTWDATVFGVFNPDFRLYIKHEDLSEIAHSGQCLSISVLQLWILHLTETSMRAGNSDIYGFLKPQSIQRSGQSQFESESYIKTWMQSSKCDVYLGAYLNGALKGLDDAPQPKSKASARWIVVKDIKALLTELTPHIVFFDVSFWLLNLTFCLDIKSLIYLIINLATIAYIASPSRIQMCHNVIRGLGKRVEGRGVVHNGWVQQQLILAHPSVGCFVTHYGAGSLTEALMNMCQMVLLPQPRGDHVVNARVMGGNLKVGVEVERGEEDGLFKR
ncbi:UDP-glycosyltransferase 79B30 [Glycine soja]|uniref:UDP-glycosyltransferase 79B30 n=1 Tax=Glycine soja TaxID=3848 RepID=A0A445IKF0_GLYSO|nr:UDP-glycosyltransferase 79B30 [Glycine soja]